MNRPMQENPKQFKGYTLPGPTPPGARLAAPHIPDNQTLDAISGQFRIYQYKDGHRFSTDDVLVAWYGCSHAPSPERVLDLGSGIGSVGMIAAWRLPGSKFVTVEAQPRSVELARKSALYNGLSTETESRYEIRQGDFRELASQLGRFDLVLGSPPYFPLDAGITAEGGPGAEQKTACRFEVRGGVEDYCATAAHALAPGGVFAFCFPIAPANQMQRVLNGTAKTSLKIIRMRPVVFKEGEAPLLGLFLAARQADLPERFRGTPPWEEPALTIRRRDGAVHPEYSAVKLSVGFPP